MTSRLGGGVSADAALAGGGLLRDAGQLSFVCTGKCFEQNDLACLMECGRAVFHPPWHDNGLAFLDDLLPIGEPQEKPALANKEQPVLP